MNKFIGVAIFLVTISVAASQFDGPVPPRLAIPGASPVGRSGGGGAIRSERVLPPHGLVRIRRPQPLLRPQPINNLPIQNTRTLIDEAKPVSEENEEDFPEPFVPQILSSPPQQPQPPQALFTNEPNFEIEDQPISRFQAQERPAPIRASDRFVPNAQPQQQQPKPAPARARPAYNRPQYQSPPQQEEQIIRQAPQRIAPQRLEHNSHRNVDEQRERKPVAQILRKYREENEDGSITWGFENDDGSFKEEVIGTDCVTRGRYGYIDPDGLKREYNYETGILCDPLTRGHNEEEEKNGYVDYQENKAVLANGVKIDLSQMGRNKSKRPSQNNQNLYRN